MLLGAALGRRVCGAARTSPRQLGRVARACRTLASMWEGVACRAVAATGMPRTGRSALDVGGAPAFARRPRTRVLGDVACRANALDAVGAARKSADPRFSPKLPQTPPECKLRQKNKKNGKKTGRFESIALTTRVCTELSVCHSITCITILTGLEPVNATLYG